MAVKLIVKDAADKEFEVTILEEPEDLLASALRHLDAWGTHVVRPAHITHVEDVALGD